MSKNLRALLADSERFHTHVETMIEPELLERAKRLHEACEQTARTYPYEGRFCAAALEET